MSWAAVKSHDWVEGTKDAAYPGASPASPGVCFAHPAGSLHLRLRHCRLGHNCNMFWDWTAGNGADLYAWTNFTSILQRH